MKLTLKFAALVAVVIAFYGCEKCSTCDITYYSASCTCDLGDFGTTTTNEDDLTKSEWESFKSSCSGSGFCSFTDTSKDDNREECGKKKDVEEKVDDLEGDGWSCSSIE